MTVIEALGHEWGEGKETKAPTCTEAGEKTYTCTRCNATKTEAIAALGHAYSVELTVDKEATCEEAGSKSHHCTRPGCDSKSKVTVIEALGHEWGEGKITKAPTCTETGEKTYTCTRCNVTKTEAVEALGHHYSVEWTIDKEATTTETGSKSHHCTVCGDRADITIIPMIKEEVKVDIKVEVVKKEDTPDTSIEGSKDEVINSVLTEDEIKAVNDGAKVEVSFDISNIEKTVTDSDKRLIDDKLKAGEKIGTILDIALNKTVDGNTNSVHELNSAITLKVAVPDSIVNKDAAIQREYGVIRIHNGVSENIDATYNAEDNTITFATDRFSTYAIVYSDTVKSTEDNNKPTTDDNKPTTDNNKPTTGDNKPTTGDNKPTTDNNKPTTDNNEAATKDNSSTGITDNGSTASSNSDKTNAISEGSSETVDNDVATADTMYPVVLVWLMFVIGSGVTGVLLQRRKKNM